MEASEGQKKAALHISHDTVEKLRALFADHKDQADILVLTALTQPVILMIYRIIDLDKLDSFLEEFSNQIKETINNIDRFNKEKKP